MTYQAPYTQEAGPPLSVVHIAINPKNFNRADLLQLAYK